MKNWHPDIDLDRLLAALGEEIIDTSDEDIRALCGQVGSPLPGITRDMRARVAATMSRDEPKMSGLRVHATCPRDIRVRSH